MATGEELKKVGRSYSFSKQMQTSVLLKKCILLTITKQTHTQAEIIKHSPNFHGDYIEPTVIFIMNGSGNPLPGSQSPQNCKLSSKDFGSCIILHKTGVCNLWLWCKMWLFSPSEKVLCNFDENKLQLKSFLSF